MKRFILLSALFGCFKICPAQTISSLWNEYKANPFNHSNIPNNSYAGYGTGMVSLPAPAKVPINVTTSPYNAIPNDTINDQPAIQAAIDAAGAAGGGIVYLPAGNYCLYKPLYIKYNNVIVRGQGSTGATATILDFKFSMYSMYKPDIDASGQKLWVWWSTGLVWIGPGDAFKSNGAPDMFKDFEDWRFSSTLATVTRQSNPGAFSITVNNTASLTAGMKILLCYQMPSDRSFIKYIYGHTPTASGIDSNKYVGDCTGIISPLAPYYYWPAVIQNIKGDTITFDRPLRLKVDPALWPATIRSIKSMVTESGIENVQVKGYNTSKMAHLPGPTSTTKPGIPTLGGWNGVYINRSWNCWVNNVRFVNLECGVIFSAAKNCSALNTFITSTSSDHRYHHPYTFRQFSSDNLVENFTIDGPGSVFHGISAEWFSSGNVYSKGLMKVGTFDTHRGVAFDLIRTEITVANDVSSFAGGAVTSGPFAGKRNAHWNVIQKIQPGYPYENPASRKGDNVYEPLQYPMGALVAITVPLDSTKGEYMPPPLSGGNLGSRVITGPITDSTLINLYRAELGLRKSTVLPTVSITSPANNVIYAAPATIKINATASELYGTISSVKFYKGSTYLNTDVTSPYSSTLSNLGPGTYSITAKAIDNNGAQTISAPITIIVNKAPAVSVTSPSNNATYIGPVSLSITANASDSDGVVSNVKFYNGSTYLNTDVTSPYTSTLPSLPPGNYAITAKATDNTGLATTSNIVNISVVPDIAPQVSMTSPVNGTTYTAPATITLSANATDADGTIKKVDFYNGASLIFTEMLVPYSRSWLNVPGGNYSITAKATDNNGKTTTSSPVTISVTGVSKSTLSGDKLNLSPKAQSLNVSPNPVVKTLSVSFYGLQSNNKSTISILSATGMLIKTIRSNILNENVKLDVSLLTAGVYYIKVINGDKVFYKQFVKL